jgi:hypothetical protein
MNAKKLTGLAVGAAATDSLNLGQAQAEAMVWCGTAGGSANAITLAPTPAITAYAAGQRFVWKASGSVNTGATTVAISGLGAIALQDSGAALVGGDHAAGKIYMGILDTTSTVQIINVQVSSINPLRVTSLVVSGTATVGGILSVDDTTTSTSGTTGSIHTDGGLGVAGTAFVAGAATVGGASQFNSTVTVGVNDTGYDVKLFGATSGKSLLWDESADSLIVTGTTTLVGTTNLDAVDIDGATQIDGTVTVGVNDTGYDVKFFGATSGRYMLWDESADRLKFPDATKISLGTTEDLQIFHDGTSSFINESGSGGLRVGTSQLQVQNAAFDENMILATADGAVTLYHNNVAKIATASTGVTITGEATATGFTGTLDGILGSGAAAAATVTTLNTTGAVTFNDAGADVDFRVESDGNANMLFVDGGTNRVGIGTASPLGSLHVAGATTTSGILITNSSSGLNIGTIANHATWQGSGSSDDFVVAGYGARNLILGTNGAEQARIDSSGNLLVGTTSTNPVGSRVNGAAIGADSAIRSRSAAGLSYFGLSVTSGVNMTFYTDNGSAFVTGGSISTNGGTTAFNTTSDYRLKNNIQPLTDALSRVALLRPVKWTWKEELGGTEPNGEGFVAHELAEILPMAVTGEKDELDEDGKPKYQGVDTKFLVATLTAAIQEQQVMIEALTTRITALEG